MTDEQDLRRPLDPVIAGLADGANAGYQALEFVTQGLREGLRRQTRVPSRHPDRDSGFVTFAGTRAQSDALAAPDQAAGGGQLIENVLGIIEGFLGVASDMTRALTELNVKPDDDGTAGARRTPSAPFQLNLRGRPGAGAAGDLELWNTSGSALSDVTFNATELIAASGSIPGSAVSFSPATVQIGPGQSATIQVTVCVPDAAKPGRYHGCIQPTVAGTWAVVGLEVAPALSA